MTWNDCWLSHYEKLPEYPLFYNFPYALRFEIGPEQQSIGPLYFKEAQKVALKIWKGCFSEDEPIDVCIEVYQSKKHYQPLYWMRRFFRETIPFSQIETTHEVGPEGVHVVRFIIDTQLNQLKVSSLLQTIIQKDFSRRVDFDVLITRQRDGLTYYLYDDRGLDLVAPQREILRPYYEQFQSHLLAYDQLEMEERMKDE